MMFKKYIYLATVFTLIIVVFLSSCTPQTTAPNPAATVSVTSAAHSSTPRVLNILHPQSPTILNIHLTNNVKDFEPARIIYEPLAVFNKDGELVPVLAEEIPTLENGQLSEDGKSVTWNLRRDIRWSDGEPFTADDVIFTYSYITDPAVKATTASNYSQVTKVESVGDFSIKITFKDINPAWAVPFVGYRGVIIPRHIFDEYKGENAREAPANRMPIGTGPYMVTEPGIKPQEVLLLGSQIVQTTKIIYIPNPYYRFPEKIIFDRIVWRGGGTVNEAARLSLQVGTVDVSYDLDLVDITELTKLLENSKGKLVSAFAPGVERILLNRTDPNRSSADQEYSSIQLSHSFFNDKKVRQAFAYAINRESIAALYGANGLPAYAALVSPPQYQSPGIFYEYDLEKAKTLLEESDYIDTNDDGIREKNGVPMKVVFQSYVGAIAQRAQQIVQKDLKEIGIDVDLKIIDSTIMFGAGATNPDSVSRFNADMLMFRTRSGSPDPTAFMEIWTCKSIPQKANNWTGNNNERWCNEAYDTLLQQAKTELDQIKRQKIFIEMNDILIEDVVMIPVVWRASALGVNQDLTGLDPTPWDSITWNIQDWHFIQP